MATLTQRNHILDLLISVDMMITNRLIGAIGALQFFGGFDLAVADKAGDVIVRSFL